MGVQTQRRHAPVRVPLVLAALVMVIIAGCTGRVAPAATPAAAPPTSVAATPVTSPTRAPTASPVATAAPTLPPTATAAPTPPPTAAPTPVSLRGLVHTKLPPAPDRDLYSLAAQLSTPPGAPQAPRVVNATPVSYQAGRKDTFWLVDLSSQQMYQQSFELRLVSPHAYWYVADGQTVAQEDLERAAAGFEAEVYPRVTAAFGKESSPGVDNDTHISIINAQLRGAGGYVSSADGYAQQVNAYSNQREAIYINIAAFPVPASSYLPTVAHELQHLVHENGDPSEDTWVNEGLSDLSATLSGTARLSFGYGAPQVSLVHWPVDGGGLSAHYQAASLFFHYLREHYAGDISDLRNLVGQPANGAAGVEAYLRAQGYPQSFREVFQDWVVANFLDEPSGKYGYHNLMVTPGDVASTSGFTQLNGQVPQYAARYVEIKDVRGPLRLRFQGAPDTPLLPVDVGDAGCWWSNSGDAISSTLTRALDLSRSTQAILTYQVWHQVEEDWDYGYLEVSSNDGQTWTVLEPPHTTRSNPLGNSYGPGYTGDSQGWLDERIDLGDFIGRQVLLRFHYLTDDGVNDSGLCVRQFSIPGAGVAPGDQGWHAEGFVLTGNRVAQEYLVQVIETGASNRVTAMSLDAANQGELVLQTPDAPGRLVAVVAALAPKTRQVAPFTLTVEPAG